MDFVIELQDQHRELCSYLELWILLHLKLFIELHKEGIVTQGTDLHTVYLTDVIACASLRQLWTEYFPKRNNLDALQDEIDNYYEQSTLQRSRIVLYFDEAHRLKVSRCTQLQLINRPSAQNSLDQF